MRWLSPALVLAVLSAGCVGDEKTPAPEAPAAAPGAPEGLPPLPANITRSIEVAAGFDAPLPVGDEQFCWMPTQACAEEPVTIPEASHGIIMNATLQWTDPAANFGLFVYQGEEALDYDSGPDPEAHSRTLGFEFTQAGDYRLVVDPHWAAAASAELTATFSWS